MNILTIKGKSYRVFNDIGDSNCIEVFNNMDTITYDSETTGLSPFRDNIALMQFYSPSQEAVLLQRIRDGVVPQSISEIMFKRGREIIGHNLVGFDAIFLAVAGVPWDQCKLYDTLVGEGVVTTTSRKDVSVSLKESVRRRLGLELDKEIEHGHWTEELSERQIEYACGDVIYLADLKQSQVDKAIESKQLDALNMEMELLPVSIKMSVNGLPLKRSSMKAYLGEQSALIQASEAKLREWLGPINLNSPAQVRKAFLENRGVNFPDLKHETMVDDVEFGGDMGEAAQTWIDYKAPAQRLKLYQESWQNQYIINERVHSRFWQVGTDTSRYSSSDPNLQQVPKDGRKIIGGNSGFKIVSVDHSQIEVRVAAALAHDEVLLALLKEGDVHAAIASAVYGVPISEVTKKQRKNSKAMTFTLLFGGGAYTLYRYAHLNGSNITMDEVNEFISGFFARFKGLDNTKKRAEQMSKAPPVFIRLPNGWRRILVGRQCTAPRILNTTVQGTAAIGLKRGMILANQRGLVAGYLGSAVHDELVSEVPESQAEEYGRELSQAMIDGMHQTIGEDVIVKTETTIGDFWS
jgi:DNA polymerase I-like protein with 3'-5' exonuclease and polymerase domains